MCLALLLIIGMLPLFKLLLSLKLWFFGQVRVPFSAFRPVNPEDPPLDPFLVHTLTIRFEPKRQVCFSFWMIQHLFLGFDHCYPNTFIPCYPNTFIPCV